MKIGRNVLHLNIHWLTKSDFPFDVKLSFLWHHFMQKNSAAWWANTKHMPGAYTAGIRQFLSTRTCYNFTEFIGYEWFKMFDKWIRRFLTDCSLRRCEFFGDFFVVQRLHWAALCEHQAGKSKVPDTHSRMQWSSASCLGQIWSVCSVLIAICTNSSP